MLLDRVLRPQPRATREFEDLSGLQRVTERGLHEPRFTEPFGAVFRPAIVPSFPQKPFVVLTGPSLVVLELLSENFVSIHLLSGYVRLQPRAARERRFALAFRRARLVGCSALILIQPSPCSH